jgi:hypothetical protein
VSRIVAGICVAVFVAFALAVTCSMENDCEKKGGTMVKGIWGDVKCIGATK